MCSHALGNSKTAREPWAAGAMSQAVTDTVVDVDNGWQKIPLYLYNNRLDVGSIDMRLTLHKVMIAKINGRAAFTDDEGLTQEAYHPTPDNPIKIQTQMRPG